MDSNALVPPRISSIPMSRSTTSSRVPPEPSSPVAAPQLTRRGHSDSASATLERQLRSTRQGEGIAPGETWKDFLRSAGADDGEGAAQAESSRTASMSSARPDQFRRPALPSSATSPVAAQQTEWSRTAKDERWMDYMRWHDSQRAGKEKDRAMPMSARSQSHTGIPSESGSGFRISGESSSEWQRQKARQTWEQNSTNLSPERTHEERPQQSTMSPFIPYRQDRQLSRKRNPSTEFPSTKRAFSGSTAHITSPTSPIGAGTSERPIDLTSPVRTTTMANTSHPVHTQRQHARETRRQSSSSFVLPLWQPDDAVESCTVCQTPFSFLFRRHHCRKCGRVVCANCSPHRITIPRQFIVQPPATSSATALAGFNTSPERGAAGFAARLAQELAGAQSQQSLGSFGSAEVVRVCNPCVPDPNFSPPPQLAPNRSFFNPNVPAFDLQANGRPHIPQRGASLAAYVVPSDSSQRLSSAYAAYQYLQQGVPPAAQSRAASIAAPRQFTVARPPAANSNLSSSQPQHRHSVATSTFLHRHALQPRSSSLSQAPQPPRAPAPRRPPIREEDECPVCGRELPPKGPDGDETAREQHVMDCINSYSAPVRSASPAPPSSTTGARTASQAIPGALTTSHAQSASAAAASSSTSVSLPSASAMPPPGPSTPFAASAAPPAPILSASASSHSASISAAATSSTPPAPMFRATPHPARMLVYHATEKDLIDPSTGEPQECVICFEEFEEGDELGRLECLCKFHRTCIRGWWERKGRGACPTHQVGEYM